MCGLLVAHSRSTGPDRRRYGLAPGAAEALTHESSLSYLAPLPRMFAAAGRLMPEPLDAYRTGDGVSSCSDSAAEEGSRTSSSRP